MNSQKKLKFAYLLTFIALMISGAYVFTSGYKITQLDHLTSINIQQLLILLVLVCTPGVLVWSKKKVKLLRVVESLEYRLKEYNKIELIRLVVFGILGLLTIIVQLLSDLTGIAMLFLIILCLFLFIWPTTGRFEQETGYIDNTESEEERSDKGVNEELNEEDEEEEKGI